jgi:hypothetical protein
MVEYLIKNGANIHAWDDYQRYCTLTFKTLLVSRIVKITQIQAIIGIY